jgi:ABC-type transport system involved in Fe-S cluster assembly fused permease/ATPase subunit
VRLNDNFRKERAIYLLQIRSLKFVTLFSDTLTERSVQEALDRLGSQRTVLVIAHRLGTIRNADNIIVLKDGVVAEQGTHDELLEKKGIYAS